MRSGIVDKNVDPAKPRERFADETLYGVLIRDVRRHTEHGTRSG